MFRNVQAHMVLAMAQQKLGQPEAARATLASGIAIAETKLSKSGGGDQWHDWIVAHALIREARALIEGSGGG